jgi:hypothetical protein
MLKEEKKKIGQKIASPPWNLCSKRKTCEDFKKWSKKKTKKVLMEANIGKKRGVFSYVRYDREIK